MSETVLQQAAPCRRHRVGDWVFGRVAAALAAVLSLLVMVGCMNINFGDWGSSPSSAGSDANGVLAQDGRIAVRAGSEQVIYYPVAYTAPPNLELEDSAHQCDIVEQSETCFRVRFRGNVTSSQQWLSWKARGVRPSAAPAATTATSVETAPPATLAPPAPVPVVPASGQR